MADPTVIGEYTWMDRLLISYTDFNNARLALVRHHTGGEVILAGEKVPQPLKDAWSAIGWIWYFNATASVYSDGTWTYKLDHFRRKR